MSYKALFTTKIPHHSSHSGYEQLIKYIDADEVLAQLRKNTTQPVKLTIERILRRLSVSRWYQWDGIETEFKTLKLNRVHGDNLIAHFLYGDTAIGLLPYFSRWLSANIVLSIHACPSDLPDVVQYPKSLKNIDHLVLLGSNQKSFFLNNGLSEEQMTVVPHGVDLQYFKPSQQNNPITDNFDVLIVGNWRRNFTFYRKLIAEVSAGYPFHFHIVTADFNHHYFRGLEQVTLYDNIPDQKLLHFYQQANAMLLAVKDAVANNVLLEAMACGLPIVCEKVGALPEYLGADYDCFFEKNDTGEALAILNMLQNQEKSDHIRNYLVDRSLQYNWKNVAEQFHKIYNRL